MTRPALHRPLPYMIIVPNASAATRPQGLWKKAKGRKAGLSTATPQDSESDQLTRSDLGLPANTLKRKHSPPTPNPSSTELRDFVQDWLRSGNLHSNALSDSCRSTTRTEMPAGGLENTIITCDWIKLKQTFSRAIELYQSALPPIVIAPTFNQGIHRRGRRPIVSPTT